MEHQCGCGSIHNEAELGIQYSLYNNIDMNFVECLNEHEEDTGVTVFKPWEERLDTSKFVESSIGNDLLFKIPFTKTVKLKGLIVKGGEGQSHPSKVKLFKNRENMNFSDVTMTPDQEFELCNDENGVHEYPIKVVRFSSVDHLCLYFFDNGGAERSKIYYIGLKGELTNVHRHGVTICTYELVPQKDDLSQRNMDNVSREIC